jgi:hypothetical protein
VIDQDRVLRLLRSIADDTSVLRQGRLKSLRDLDEFVSQVAAYVTGA